MAMNLEGNLVETCSCNVHCPCWFGVPELMKMDKGWCDTAFLFRVENGESNGVDLAGCNLAYVCMFPGPTLFDGNGTGRLYIDESANEEQRRELEAVFQGKVGGPMEILGGLMSSWLPSEFCGIDIQDDGEQLTAKVGDVGEIRAAVLKNEAGDAVTVQDAGFAVAFNFADRRFSVAPSDSRWADSDLPRTFETLSGARASWSWNVA
jgi:hypothetical protein